MPMNREIRHEILSSTSPFIPLLFEYDMFMISCLVSRWWHHLGDYGNLGKRLGRGSRLLEEGVWLLDDVFFLDPFSSLFLLPGIT